ncbi:MAG: carboxypeptidase regulatory-like domain-containing protein [Planctomycetes bacterium]|nr:carboxypeptidase regulatory-like domain-containing protein [Planctomycetota bacterium]
MLPLVLGHRTMAHLEFQISGYAPTFVQAEPGHSTAAEAHQIVLRRGAQLKVIVVPPGDEPRDGLQVRVLASPRDLLADVDRPGFARATTASGITEDPITHQTHELVAGLKPQEWWQTTNASGLALFDGLPTDVPLQVTVQAGGGSVQAQRQVAIAAGADGIELRIDLEPLGAVRGRLLLPSGQPAGNRVVIACASHSKASSILLDDRPTYVARTRTDATGDFQITSLTPGDYFVGPSLSKDDPFGAGVIARSARKVTVRATGCVDMGALQTVPTSVIRGVVVDDKGALVAGAMVLAFVKGEPGAMRATSGADGGFELGPLLGGRYGLYASAKGAVGGLDSIDLDGSSPETCTLVLDTLGSLHIVADPKARGSGSILACVRLGGALEQQWTYRGADSEVTFESIPPGRYDLWAELGDGSVARKERIEIAKGAPRTEIVLEPERGALLDARNLSTSRSLELTLRSAAGALLVREEFGPRKHISFRLPAGTVGVRVAEGETEIEQRSIDLEEGGTLSLAFGG